MGFARRFVHVAGVVGVLVTLLWLGGDVFTGRLFGGGQGRVDRASSSPPAFFPPGSGHGASERHAPWAWWDRASVSARALAASARWIPPLPSSRSCRYLVLILFSVPCFRPYLFSHFVPCLVGLVPGAACACRRRTIGGCRRVLVEGAGAIISECRQLVGDASRLWTLVNERGLAVSGGRPIYLID